MAFAARKGVFRCLVWANCVCVGATRGIVYGTGFHGRKRHLTTSPLFPSTRRNSSQTGTDRRKSKEDGDHGAAPSLQDDDNMGSPLRHWLDKQGISVSTRLSDESLEALASLGVETEDNLLSFSAADLETLKEIVNDEEAQAVKDIVAELRKREKNVEARKQHEWSVPCISVDPNTGNSFFTEKVFHLRKHGLHSVLSRLLSTSGMLFRETPSHYCFNWHCPSKCQFIVNLDAGVEIEVSDGTRRIFQAGSIVFLEDTLGKGHRSRAVDGRSRKSIMIYAENDELL